MPALRANKVENAKVSFRRFSIRNFDIQKKEQYRRQLIREVTNYLDKLYKNRDKTDFFVIEKNPVSIFENTTEIVVCNGFRISIEIFDDGVGHINFVSQNKVFIDLKYLAKEIFYDYLKKNGIQPDKFEVLLVNKFDKKKRFTFDLYYDNTLQEIRKLDPSEWDVSVNNYKFFNTFSEYQFKSIWTLLQKKCFVCPEINSVSSIFDVDNNFVPKVYSIIGNNIILKNESSLSGIRDIFQKGAFLPVMNWTIVPVILNPSSYCVAESFKQKFIEVNGGLFGCDVLDPLLLQTNDGSPFEPFERINNKLYVLFADSILPAERIKKICKNKNVKILKLGKWGSCNQEYKIANFVYQCVHAMGGQVKGLDNMCSEDLETIFIGIDISYEEFKKGNSSAYAAFDKRGKLILSRKYNSLITQEQIDSGSLHDFLVRLRRTCSFMHSRVDRIVFHRDGKALRNDVQVLEEKSLEVFNNVTVDILEIIKNGAPVIEPRTKGNREFTNYFFLDQSHNYAVLVSNCQAEMSHPIAIKHVFGNTRFGDLLWQVFWLSNVSRKSLFNSTRLPETINKAHSLSKNKI